jgi:hypothetical protein
MQPRKIPRGIRAAWEISSSLQLVGVVIGEQISE